MAFCESVCVNNRNNYNKHDKTKQNFMCMKSFCIIVLIIANTFTD